MNTQKETVNIIRQRMGHYIGALKGNQNSLFNDVNNYFTEKKLKAKKGTNSYLKASIEKAHNNIETREFYIVNSKKFYQETEWKDINSIVLYRKTSEKTHQPKDPNEEMVTVEDHYFISSLTDLNIIADGIRNHWQIENGLHWHLDMTKNEDKRLLYNETAVTNWSSLLKLTLTVVKLYVPLAPVKRLSVKTATKGFLIDLESRLSEIFSAYDDSELMNYLKASAEEYYNK